MHYVRVAGDICQLNILVLLCCQIQLSAYGSPLFNGRIVRYEHSFPLLKCFEHAEKDQPITVKEDGREKELNIKLLIPFEGTWKMFGIYLAVHVYSLTNRFQTVLLTLAPMRHD